MSNSNIINNISNINNISTENIENINLTEYNPSNYIKYILLFVISTFSIFFIWKYYNNKTKNNKKKSKNEKSNISIYNDDLNDNYYYDKEKINDNNIYNSNKNNKINNDLINSKFENNIEEKYNSNHKNKRHINRKKNKNKNQQFEDIPQNNKIEKNDDVDIELIKSIGYINAQIQEEPQIGLNNIGATCYMNSTLQCLSHTTKLTNYFLASYNQNYINSDANIFSKSYLEVLKKLWIKKYNNYKDNYSPNEFKNILSQLNPLFEGIAANDAKDLVQFILEKLHSELNKNINNINENNMNINQYDEQQVLGCFIEDFKNNQSIISDIFYGITETKTECLSCKQKNQMNNIFNPVYTYNFQIFNFIIFPLEEIRKTKSIINNFNYNEVNLYDCFDYYEKEEIMQGENSMWCNICRQNAPAKYSSIIYSSPEYFILILNRGKGNIYNVKLNFLEIIDIGRYVKMKGRNNLTYQLYAIVTHLGPSSMAGHFIAFCKSPIDNMWYKYNDGLVDLIGNSFNDIPNFGCPYILFYERQGL